MKKLSISLACIIAGLIGISAFARTANDSILQAYERQMAGYPLSEQRDVYKNFFQDYFGPGHIIADTASAANYLRYELQNSNEFIGPLYEPTGYKGNFYRVSLQVIKDGLVPFDTYLDAFVRSVNGIQAPMIDEWKTEWRKINDVIKSSGTIPVNYAEDNAKIDSLLATGQYAFHHSRTYNDAYHPHYRIIARNIFENEILPIILMKSNKKTKKQMQPDGIVRLSKIEVYPQYLDEYLKFATEVGSVSLQTEPGVLTMYAVAEKDNPCKITILETYASQDAYKKHIASDHFQKYKKGTLHMIKSLELVDQMPLNPSNIIENYIK